MIPNLNFDQLINLLRSVFHLQEKEPGLAILVDLPNAALPDSPQWNDRRTMAVEWFRSIQQHISQTGFDHVDFVFYGNVGSNNNDLPANVYLARQGFQEISYVSGDSVPLEAVLRSSSVVLAMTELSATAPLKVLAKKYMFRGATLPGFTREMIPALGLDYEKINDRVMQFKNRMDAAQGISVHLSVSGKTFSSYYDLRFRSGHASGGLMREPGTVANLPSGEAYIVPYEGEKVNEPSKTSGTLPVQFDSEIVTYMIEGNKAVEVMSTGKFSDSERAKLSEEPAYGNIAEVGIGVLGEWGVKAVGSTLLDEKLGLHIAFGRSEHFGGVTGPLSFRNPKNVVHIDRVYVPSVQPLISVDEVAFLYEGGKKETIIRSGNYVV
jgi:hypothetical protein